MFGKNGVSGVEGATPSPNEIIAGPVSSVIGPLVDNGGPTQTHALVAGSSAIDKGNNGLIPAGVTTDQRGNGFPRIVGTTVDIGAVEGTGGSISTYTLMLGKSGGNGTVTSNPAGINCGATCSANFNSGTSVTLNASADSGYSFTGWSGDCNGASTTCTVTMDRAKSVIALFASQTPDTYPLAVSFTGMGTVTSNPVGIDCGFLRSDPCSVLFNEGTVVTLSAIPHSDRCCQNIFSGWGGACSGTDSTCTVTMDAAKNVTATFDAYTPTPETYTLILTTAGTGSGTVGGAGNYSAGTMVMLTATPNAGSTFEGWSPSPCASSFAMPTNDLGCTANFTLNSYTVTATAGANGSITSTSRTVNHGATTTFTVTPNSGYRAAVTGCNGTLSGATYTTGPITSACTVSASFTTDSIDFDATVASTISWFYAAAFSRTPVPDSTLPDYGDLGGLAFWTAAYLTGEGGLATYRGNVYAIADFFVQSPEFQVRYPESLTNEAFVAALYENMLGRAPDADGLTFWVGLLNAGASRGSVLADFTNTLENQDSNPLRKVALESFIQFIASDDDGAITPEEAAAWLAANPILDGKLVDGGSSSNVHTRVTGPLPSNRTYQMVQVDGQTYNVEAPAILTSISTTQPVSIVDTEGRLTYFGYTTPEQTTLALSGESTAIALAFMPFNLFPLTGEAAALILNELAGHPDIAIIGARIEAIVTASGYFDFDQLTPADLTRIHGVSLAIASQTSSGRATISSLDSGLLPEHTRFVQPQAAVDFLGPDAYADYLRVLDYEFQRESGGSVKAELTFENRTYLTYFTYRFSPSDPQMRLFETVPGAMPDSTKATAKDLVSEVAGALIDWSQDRPARLTLTGAEPQQKEIAHVGNWMKGGDIRICRNPQVTRLRL